jgi:Flp pilus assembly protein TadG
MIRFLRKLWNDRRGNALVIAGAALPVLVGAAGLATDTVQWALTKRQLQRAADSAALAAAYQEAQGQKAFKDTSGGTATSGTCSASATPAVTYDLTQNDHSGMSPTCNVATGVTWNSKADSNAVKVTLSASANLTFAQMFMSSAPTITASATATMVDNGSYCLVALNNTSTTGITMQGSSKAYLGCGAISDSVSTSSVTTNGSAYTFQATTVAAVGDMSDTINGCNDSAAVASGVQCTTNPYTLPEPDPYSNLSMDIPSSVTCKSSNQNSNGQTYNPGCYTDFSFSGNKSYTLKPGTYYLNNCDFSTSGSVSITGTGVTIILTGTSPGKINLNGNTTLKLSAPTSGTYTNMLIMQSGTNLSSSNASDSIDGNSGSYFDGAIYAPKGNITFGGSSSTANQCTMVVGWTVNFSGNTSQLQKSLYRPDGTACTNATTVSGKQIRLVA